MDAMSTDTQHLPVAEYITGSFVLMLTYTVLLGVLTSPIIFTTGRGDNQLIGYAVVAILIFALLISQKILVRDVDVGAMADLSTGQKILATLAAIAFYNIIILLAMFVGSFTEMLAGPTLGILVAAAYPIWEDITGRVPLPVSFTGLVGTVAFVLVLLGVIGATLLDLIREAEYFPLRYFDMRRFGGTGRIR